MKTRTFTSIAVMTALGVFLPMSSSHAFGLGKIELSSALNQPFRAQIPVTTLRDDEKGNLQVQLASADEFERAGLERSYYLTQFEFTVVEQNGQTVIDVRSKKPVKEPFIDLLLTATTGQGRLIREYVVLLDPPKDIFVKPEAKASTVTTTTTQPSTPASFTTPVPTTNYSPATSYGPTDRDDTLWSIAQKTKQADTTVNQMMMALLSENPDAFSNNNINGLKAGYTLDIPSTAAIKKLSKSQATAAVSEQNKLWKNRNATPTKTETVVTPASDTDSVAQQTAAMTAKENAQVMTEHETTARLKLVAPSDDTVSDETEMSPMGDTKLSELSEQLTLAQETIETQRQENIDINARMMAMEEQIETLRRLLSLKDPDLAVLQSTLEQQQAAAAASEVAGQTELAQAENADELTTEDSAQTDTSQPGSEQLTDLTPAETDEQMMLTEESVSAAMNDDSDSTQEAMLSPESEDTAVEKALDSVGGAVDYVSELAGLDNEQVKSKYDQVKTYIKEHKKESALGALFLLLVIWLIISFRKRRYVAWDEAVDKKSNTEQTNVSRPQIVDNNDVVDTEVATEAEDEPEKTLEQLVNDADVYVSYGDFAKAKQTLQMAHDAEPSNEEIIHKLLFVLFKQAQVSDFVALAEYYQNETNAPEWDEVVSWGQELAPHEELFQPVITEPVQALEPEASSIETMALDTNIEEDDLALDIEGLDTSSTETVDDELKSFDVTQQQAVDDEFTLDINTGSSEVDDSEERLTLPEVEQLDLQDETSKKDTTSEVDTSTMEFDLDISDNDETALDISDIEAVTDDDLSEANAALKSDSELEFDLGDFDQVDESETKLDLAAAYIDMGDPDGAKSILQEVLAEGNDDQKARAETILSELK